MYIYIYIYMRSVYIYLLGAVISQKKGVNILHIVYMRIYIVHIHVHSLTGSLAQTEKDPITNTSDLVYLGDRAVVAPAGVARHRRDQEASGSSRSM
jgi:hypothetical protein